jgi:NTE family protein
VRAVAASCAVPGVFPPVTVDGRRYIDGGVRSGTNADLAAGASAAVVLAPMARLSPMAAPPAELEVLRRTGPVVLVAPDDAADEAIGPNVLDVSRRAAAAEAGLVQGATLVDEIAAIWPG